MKSTTPAAAPGAPAAFYCAENYRPEESVGYLMRQILSVVAHDVSRHLAHTELTNAQWVPLFKLYTGHASTVAELARACQLDAGATTRLLDRMESKGLCQRVRSEEDRRVVHIVLTESGRQAASEIPRVLSGVQNAYLADFSQEEFDSLKGYLRRILSNAKASQTTPADVAGTPGAPDAA